MFIQDGARNVFKHELVFGKSIIGQCEWSYPTPFDLRVVEVEDSKDYLT